MQRARPLAVLAHDHRAAGVPNNLFSFVWRTSGWHQPWLAAMSILAFLLGTVPLEIQRRIINDALKGGLLRRVLMLVALYMLVVLALGLVKLMLNLYRNWLGERAIRDLRGAVFASAVSEASERERIEGVQLSVLLDEAEPVGNFVGECFSQPVQQAGLLISVSAYLAYLQPLMAIVSLTVLVPQMALVAPIQAAINRRISRRIDILRALSGGVVVTAGAIDTDQSQHRRIDQVFRLNMSIYRLKFTLNFLTNVIAHSGTAAILGMGGYYVITGVTEVGTVVAFLAGLGQILQPWDELVTWYRDMASTRIKYRYLQNACAIGALGMMATVDPPAPDRELRPVRG
jgi:ABC-type multidrug transport system fused ATPase/permease subunit